MRRQAPRDARPARSAAPRYLIVILVLDAALLTILCRATMPAAKPFSIAEFLSFITLTSIGLRISS